jgi:PhzF family phenazine biosynthesis protein
MRHDVSWVTVFADGDGGGNPAPVVLDARGMTDDEMRAVAARSGHESAFVLPPPAGSTVDLRLRFWVPNHEMEMCGHATVGALWLLASRGALRTDEPVVSTASGDVHARIVRQDNDVTVEISQPAVRTEVLDGAATAHVLDVLGVPHDRLGPTPVLNATTSRTKTLLHLDGVDTLDHLEPDLDRVEQVCTSIGSTGLYPFAFIDDGGRHLAARQFPRSSGYPEDPATGIAAAALVLGLVEHDVLPTSDSVEVQQGRAMGRPSRMTVTPRRIDGTVAGCWLGGPVELADPQG